MRLTTLVLVVFLLCFAVPARAQEEGRLGLFVSLIQDPPVLSSREEIVRLIAFAKRARISILFVQVYRAGRSWFPSQIADDAPYRGVLRSVREDPLTLLIEQAHAEGIAVHAWMNLLSLSQNTKAPVLQKYGVDILTKNFKKKIRLEDYKIDGQYFLEPSDRRVRQALLGLLGEVLATYPRLDGVQFDYIRYPDKDPYYGRSALNARRFQAATGRPGVEDKDPLWQGWKRAQVTDLLEALVKRARILRPGIQLSVTGCAPYVRAYHEAFQDWPSWVQRGLVDFVTVMTYSRDPDEYARFVRDARQRVAEPGKLNLTVGAYSLRDAPGNFARELAFCREKNRAACVIFHYGDVLPGSPLNAVVLGEY